MKKRKIIFMVIGLMVCVVFLIFTKCKVDEKIEEKIKDDKHKIYG